MRNTITGKNISIIEIQYSCFIVNSYFQTINKLLNEWYWQENFMQHVCCGVFSLPLPCGAVTLISRTSTQIGFSNARVDFYVGAQGESFLSIKKVTFKRNSLYTYTSCGRTCLKDNRSNDAEINILVKIAHVSSA